ncbi:MAG: fructose-bisphosphatase class III, partial [Pygmaiobacter massiliensis]
MVQSNLKFLTLLAREYPTVAKASSEIINLEAILKLPKPTEHFMSDLHGEYEAFTHILNNASGVIRNKVDRVLGDSVSEAQRAEFATLIYYPEKKLPQMKQRQ